MKKVILISMMIASMATALKCTLRYAPYEIDSVTTQVSTNDSGEVVAESHAVLNRNFKGGEGQSLFFVAVVDNKYDFSNMGKSFDEEVKADMKGVD